MKLNISYRHLDSSPALDDKIREKLLHLEKIAGQKIEVNWVCSIEKDRHRSEAHVHMGPAHFHAHDESENMYKSIDHVIDKVSRQVVDHNKQHRGKIHH